MHLALYCFANGQLSTALKLLYRARYLMLMVCGEDHPEMALLDVSAPQTWFCITRLTFDEFKSTSLGLRLQYQYKSELHEMYTLFAAIFNDELGFVIFKVI
jgi:hypothetical protein